MNHNLVKLNVNGKDFEVKIRPHERLLDILRNHLDLISVKEGCGEGSCGSCVVLMDGKIVNSCLVMGVQARGSKILTVEGIGDADNLHPLQESFLEKGAAACGFCTPGMLLTAKYLLDQNPNPTEHEIREIISGNLCRCTGYERIVEAIKVVVKNMRRE